MDRKLSVVVPVYNSERYLSNCIESILNQTYANIELILVNDGSTDASKEICDIYAEKDKRVIVIHKENEGVMKARFCGAEMADGDCITFVDADDWIISDTYERMLRRMEDCDIVMAGIYRYFSSDKVIADIPMLAADIYDKKALEHLVIPYMLWSIKRNTWELDPSLCTKIFKMDLLRVSLKNACKLDIHFGDDTAVIFPLMLRVNTAVIMHDCFYYHRQRPQGTVPAYFSDKCFMGKLFSLYEFLKSEFLKYAYWELLSPQLEHFCMNAVQLKQQSFFDYKETEKDIFPFWDIQKGADVVLYGAGETGKRYFRQNEQFDFCNIILWADQNYEKLCTDDQQIVSPQKIVMATYDYIIIAVRSAGIVQEIVDKLIQMGISYRKIVWNGVLVRSILMDRRKLDDQAEKLHSGKVLANDRTQADHMFLRGAEVL